MSLFNIITVRDAPFIPSLNTGTHLDIITGTFVPSTGGEMLLNGGLAHTNATVGRSQMFKSTAICGYFMNAFARYSGVDMLIYDTEKSLQEDRLRRMATVPIPETNTLKLITRSEYYAEEFFELCVALYQDKLTHKADYLVESPFIDPKTSRPKMILRPTFVLADSWSNMEFKTVEDMLVPKVKNEDGILSSKTSISSSDTNTAFMKDGLNKKKMIKELNAMAERAGIYMGFTAHLGDAIEMNPYAPSTRALQHLKASDKPKGVGNDFMFLMSLFLDCRSAKVLQDQNKQSQYPSKGLHSPHDLNVVSQVVARCKTNSSGTSADVVISQADGLCPGLTYYHTLREGGYYGLEGSKINHKTTLYPNQNLTRTTITDLLRQDPLLNRALELLYQLYMIQTTWTLRELPVPFDIDPRKLMDALTSDKIPVQDLLHTRGWWTYGHHDTPYMSLYDCLAIVSGQYRPKWLSIPKS